jgi:hypothetical protein
VVGVDNDYPWDTKVAWQKGGTRVLEFKDADDLTVSPKCKDTTNPPENPDDPVEPFLLPTTTAAPKGVKPNLTLNPVLEPIVI